MSDWKKLRELAEAATPGPWRWGDSSKERNGVQEKMMNLYSDAPRSDGDVRIIPIVWLEPSSGWNTLHDNTEWIAAANPTTILALLDENDSLRLELAATRRELERWRHSEQTEGDYVCPAGQLLEQRDEVIRERDEARAEVEKLRGAWDAGVSELTKASSAQVSLVTERLHAIEQQLSTALAAKEEACDAAIAFRDGLPVTVSIATLRSIGKDGGNG